MTVFLLPLAALPPSLLIYPPTGSQWRPRAGGLWGGFPSPAKLICMAFAKNGLASSHARGTAGAAPMACADCRVRAPEPPTLDPNPPTLYLASPHCLDLPQPAYPRPQPTYPIPTLYLASPPVLHLSQAAYPRPQPTYPRPPPASPPTLDPSQLRQL